MLDRMIVSKDEVATLLEITDERIAELLKTIRPFVRKDGVLHDIKLPVDLRNTAFKWDPEFTTSAEIYPCDTQMITTYHTAGYIMMFKPTIPEVLAQIPETLLPSVIGFEVLFNENFTENLTSDFYGHRTKTVLYFKAG